MYLTRGDKHDVMLLCLAETCLVAVANNSKPKSRRHNKIKTAIEQIKLADATYSGTLTEADFDEAAGVFDQIEAYFDGITLEES